MAPPCIAAVRHTLSPRRPARLPQPPQVGLQRGLDEALLSFRLAAQVRQFGRGAVVERAVGQDLVAEEAQQVGEIADGGRQRRHRGHHRHARRQFRQAAHMRHLQQPPHALGGVGVAGQRLFKRLLPRLHSGKLAAKVFEVPPLRRLRLLRLVQRRGRLRNRFGKLRQFILEAFVFLRQRIEFGGVLPAFGFNARAFFADSCFLAVERQAHFFRLHKLVAKFGAMADGLEQFLAAVQLGVTMASLGLGWLGEPALAHLLQPVVGLFPLSIQSDLSHSISALIAFVAITFMHVVAGELAPKSIALQDPERTSLFVAGPTLLTERIFKPAIWVLNGSGNALLRLIGVQPASGHELAHSVEELKMLVTASAAGGVVEAEESEMLHAVFDFGNLVVRQVMIPRTEIIAVEANTNLEEIIGLVSQSTYTKFPVYEDNLDQIIGIVHVKDLLSALQAPECQDCVARDLAREPLFAPETVSANVLLRQFRDNRQHIAIVMDE